MIFNVFQAKARTHIIVLAYLFCLFSFFALAGHLWSQWRFEQRGIETSFNGETDRRLGVNLEPERYTADELEVVLDDLTALSLSWVRIRMSWRTIERQDGQYEWASWDAVVQAVHRHGLSMLVVLDDPPEWAIRQRSYPLPCVPPIDEMAYARFVAAVAVRYGRWIDHYQVWDEPNLSHHWADNHVAACGYLTLLQAAYPAIHAADPTARVLGGGLAPTQAPGPDNLNDLTYLRRLYALGGAAWFDILAVKPYGFWSGPEDRRVAPDVLNFSRTVAVREIMRAHGDQTTPVWAVEWGWNVLPDGYTGPPLPWGGDRAGVQTQRIRDAILRARNEWPWLGPLIWAEYQPAMRPDLPADAPRHTFALRDAQGNKTEIYEVFSSEMNPSPVRRPTWPWAEIGLTAIGILLGAWPWAFARWRHAVRETWRAWAALPAVWHAVLLIPPTACFVLTVRLEWAAVAWLTALPILYLHPTWALNGAVIAMPFHYWAKSFGELHIAPAEPLFMAALVVQIGRQVASRRWPSIRLPDILWLSWLLIGTGSLGYAVEPTAAWPEWRLCIVEPTLLYALIRISTQQNNKILNAWFISAWLVALIGLGQWALGQWVPAGAVGRVCGPFFSPNHLALYLERVWMLALAIVLCAPGRRLGLVIAVGVIGLALFLTYSRGTWLLALPTALIVLTWLCRDRLKGWTVAVGVGGIGLIGLVLLIGRGYGPIEQEIRRAVWQSALQMIADHPWGIGLDGFQFIYPRYMRAEAWTEPLLYHPHNMWLDAAARVGIHGMLVLAFLIGVTMYQTLRIIKNSHAAQRAIGIGLLASMVAALAHGLVDSGYFLPDLAWSTALIAGLVAIYDEQPVVAQHGAHPAPQT